MLDRRCFTVTSVAALMALPLLAGPAAAQDKVTLTIESWRNDDLAIWEDVILPAFEAANPNIEVTVAGDTRQMLARQVSDDEKRDLWPHLLSLYPDFDQYQARTDRNIPVFMCE